MKALVGIAVVLGLAGTVLGIVEMKDAGGDFELEEQTIELTGGKEERIDFKAESANPSHELEAWSTVRPVSGDATGEWIVTCLPIVADHIECHGGVLLEDGDIEFEGTEEAQEDGEAISAVVGGTGAYKGSIGEVHIDFENDTYRLELLTPSGVADE